MRKKEKEKDFISCHCSHSMFAELRSYVDPPSVIMKIVQALLMILMPHHTWTSWTDCKQVGDVCLPWTCSLLLTTIVVVECYTRSAEAHATV